MREHAVIHDTGNAGTHQNIARAALILDVLATSGKAGMRLTEVMQATGLKKTVVHRALAGLVAHGLATHDGENARFHLGDKVFAWVHRAGERFSLAERVVPYLQDLEKDMQDTVYFSIIRGHEAVCYACVEGRFPIRSLSLTVGAVRPLGAGSGSLVLLAFQTGPFQERIIAEHGKERLQYGITDAVLRRSIAETRKLGYALHKGLFAEGMKGLAVPVKNSAGVCVAAVSLNAIDARLESPRREEIAARLHREAAVIETQLADLLDEI